ncbi:MAG: glycosyltransferase [Ruminococcaceae bacterium]|nr:glycosyltransferase [Oscillospiraceae bacterium]
MPVELSVAMIFKNEIRCLERSLKSLQPLRERLSVEIVMADTGSDDGSRAVAEKYADVVFDFPWIDDFAAARNAALERCSGAWALVMDCDEWLDADIDELIAFLKSERRNRFDQVMLTIRNYADAELTEYGDSRLYRLLNLSSQPRFAGAIHESAEFSRAPRNAEFDRTMLHHDGYVMLNDGSAAGRAKQARNLALLRAALEKSPDDLRSLTQYVECAAGEPDRLARLRRAVSLVEARSDEWQTQGPPLMSAAVMLAYSEELPEFDEWAKLANERFPESFFTRIDVSYILAARNFERQDFAASVRWGEAYLRARRDFAHDAAARRELAFGTLQRDDGANERDVLTILARAEARTGQAAQALSLLRNWPWEETDARQVKNFLVALQELQGSVDVSAALQECWAGIQKPLPTPARARQRVQAFRALCEVAEPVPQSAEDELLQLAAKVKAILARYPANDPAVIDLKNSEAYRKIRHLIEE